MAMIMEMPAAPAQPAAPQTKSEKTAPSSEDGFRTALKEEHLKQTKGPAAKSEKRKTEKEEDPRQVAVEAAATGTAGASVTQSWKIQDSIPETAGSALPAGGPEPQLEIAATSLSRTVTESDGTVAGIFQETPCEKATEVSGDASSKIRTSTVEVPVPNLGDAGDAATNASRPDAGANRAGDVQVLETATVKAGETARQQFPLLQPATASSDLQETKTSRSGLMEASFAGFLQPAGTKEPAQKMMPEAEIRTEYGEMGPVGEGNRFMSEPTEMAIGEADSELSEALLKQAAGRPAPSKPGENTDKGQSSLFDNALASAGPGKPGTTGELSPLHDAAQQVRSTAGSLNEEVRVLDQVLNQLPLNRVGEKNRVVIRLHPEELGEVKLEMVMEKDQLKAHLVTQTQQVQNILEKHLPRLQEALQNQGVKLDQVQVSVDSQAGQGREFFGREQQSTPWARSFASRTAVTEVAPVAAAVNQPRSTQDGLSLRI